MAESKQINFSIVPADPEAPPRVYSNFCAIAHTPFDMTLTFCEVLPLTEKDLRQAEAEHVVAAPVRVNVGQDRPGHRPQHEAQADYDHVDQRRVLEPLRVSPLHQHVNHRNDEEAVAQPVTTAEADYQNLGSHVQLFMGPEFRAPIWRIQIAKNPSPVVWDEFYSSLYVYLDEHKRDEYDGEVHTAANLFDAIKEGYYGKF